LELFERLLFASKLGDDVISRKIKTNTKIPCVYQAAVYQEFPTQKPTFTSKTKSAQLIASSRFLCNTVQKLSPIRATQVNRQRQLAYPPKFRCLMMGRASNVRFSKIASSNVNVLTL
jgi:hypothetical protein